MFLRIIGVLLLLETSNFGFALAEVSIKIEDVILEYVNGEYAEESTCDISVNYINDTFNSLSCYIKVLKEFPEDSRIQYRVLSFTGGDYNIPIGLESDISICEVKKHPIFMVPFVLAIGGDPDKCVPDEGVYENDDFFPVRMELLPKTFPRNNYRLDTFIGNSEVTLFKIKFYFKVM